MPQRLVPALAIAFALTQPKDAVVVKAFIDAAHKVHITRSDSSQVMPPREPHQVGAAEIKVSGDHRTVGWLAQFPNPDSKEPIAGKLVVWRDGTVAHVFPTDQTFWSWSFVRLPGVADVLVAFHTGPAHGERKSHCELHVAVSGRLVETWDGDLGVTDRPGWTRGLR